MAGPGDRVTASGCLPEYTPTIRHAALATMIQRGRSEKLDDSERRGRARTAARLGTSCGLCGSALAADAPVWLEGIYGGPNIFGHITRWQAPVCEGCHLKQARWCTPQPCEGCGRPVHYRPSYRRRRHVHCSARCAWTATNRRRSTATAAARRKACTVCGTVFDAPRRDARTCSPACRQRAYRQRRGARAYAAPR